jgi:hypothetical protein
MVAIHKRKGPAYSTGNSSSSTTFVVKEACEWSSIQEKLKALQSSGNDHVGDNLTTTTNYPRMLATRAWENHRQSILQQSNRLQSKLSKLIETAIVDCQQESHALHQAELELVRLVAERDALQMDLHESDLTLATLMDEISASRALVVELHAQAVERRLEREQEILKLQYMISFYALCTGIIWDSINNNNVKMTRGMLQGIVVRIL